MQLVVWGMGGIEEPLGDASVAHLLLAKLTTNLGMTAIASPSVVPFRAKDGYELTGFQLIAESHIALHAWPKRGNVVISAFTCKPYERRFERIITRELISAYGCTAITVDDTAKDRGELPEMVHGERG